MTPVASKNFVVAQVQRLFPNQWEYQKIDGNIYRGTKGIPGVLPFKYRRTLVIRPNTAEGMDLLYTLLCLIYELGIYFDHGGTDSYKHWRLDWSLEANHTGSETQKTAIHKILKLKPTKDD